MRRPFLPLLFLALLAVLAPGAALADPGHSIPFTVTGYRGPALQGFPVLVRLAEGSPGGFSYADCAADGSDVRFFDRGGAALPFDVDTWNPRGESCIWVKIPSLAFLESFTMRYGETPAAANTPSDVWSAYGGVWHMGGASGTVPNAAPSGSAYDAEPAGNTGGSAAYPGLDAPVGVARTTATDAAKGYLLVGADLNGLGFGDTFTMSGWIRMDGCSGYPRLFSTKPAYTGRDGWEIEMSNGSGQTFTARAGNNVNFNGNFPESMIGNWVHVAFCYAGSTLTVYANGARVTSGTVTATVEADKGLAFGCNPIGDNTSWIRGAYDECRLMGGAASADWIRADYAAQTGTVLAQGVSADFVQVVSSPAGMTGLSPACGYHNAAPGQTLTFTAPARADNDIGSLSASCIGWQLFRFGETTPVRTSDDEGESPLSCTVEYAEPVTLEWLFGDFEYYGWRYNASAKTVAELRPHDDFPPWVLNCTASGGSLTITGVAQSGTNSVLDLSLPVTDASGAVFTVAALGSSAFKGNARIEEVRLPDSLAGIPNFAFQNCAHLRHVRLPAFLRTIGDTAFGGCTRLRSVEPFLPDSLTSIAVNAFNGDLRLATPLRLGFGVAPGALTLGNYAFRDCAAIPSTEFGPGVTALNVGPFWGCSSLASVAMHEGVASIGQDCFNGCTALATVTPSPTPAALTSLGQSAYKSCSELVGEVVLGTNGAACALASGGSQFDGCAKITRIVLGPGVSGAIPQQFALNCSSLADLEIGGAVTSIGSRAFEGCKALPAVELPAGLTTLGGSCFSGCSSLASVTPLLPDTVTSVGSSAFRNCTSLAGDLSIAPGGTAATIGEYAFNATHVASATLGDGIATIGSYAFSSCPSLRSVKLPANLATINNNAFSDCKALTNVVPFLPATVTKVGNTAFSGCNALAGGLALDGGGAAVTLGDGAFQYCPELRSADLGAGVAALPNYAFRNDTALGRVVFGPTKPTISGSAFSGVAAYQTVWVVPAASDSWDSFLASSSSAKAWADLTAAQRESYTAAHPTEPPARALTVASPANQWVVSYGASAEGAFDVVVAGHPSNYGVGLSPAYGTYRDVAASLPMSLSAPLYAKEPTTKWRCTGYRIEAATDGGFASAVDSALADPDAPAATYDPDAPGLRRFSWLWEPAGYKVSVTPPPDPSLGTVSLSGADADGYFTAGSVATVTASGGAGSPFVRWHGDVPAGHETDATLQLVMDGPKSLVPEFASGWVFDENAKTLSDGYWTFNASGTRDAIVVGKPKLVYDVGILDLRKPVVDGGAIVGIGADALNTDTAQPVLREVRLPDTLRTVGARAFKGCRVLETVSPLLPASVTFLGGQAFDADGYEMSLASPLFLGTNGTPVTISGTHHFRQCRFPTAVLGAGVTNIPANMFDSNPVLLDVRAHDGIRSIGSMAFYRCTALTNFTPLLPASLESLGGQAFDNNGSPMSLATPLYLGTNGTPVTISGTHHFRNCRIPSAVLGTGVTNVPANFLQGNATLVRVALHDGIVSIGSEAFRGCGALAEVTPFLPSSLASLGKNVFFDDKSLGGDLTFGTGDHEVSFHADGYQFYNTRIASAFVGRRAGAVPPYAFANNPALADVRLVSMSSIGNCAFENDTGLRDLYLGGPVPALHVNAFKSWKAGQCLLHVQTRDETWEAWLALNVDPWAGLTDDLRDDFLDDRPGLRLALGRTKTSANPASQWVVYWARFPPPTVLIVK